MYKKPADLDYLKQSLKSANLDAREHSLIFANMRKN